MMMKIEGAKQCCAHNVSTRLCYLNKAKHTCMKKKTKQRCREAITMCKPSHEHDVYERECMCPNTKREKEAVNIYNATVLALGC